MAAVRLLMGEGHYHVPCMAHLLNLCVFRVLERTSSINDVIEKVKQIVTYFRRSISSSDALRAAQRQKGVLVPLELIQAVQTRWNSTFYSLQRFAELAGCVSQVLLSKDHRTAPPMLTSGLLLPRDPPSVRATSLPSLTSVPSCCKRLTNGSFILENNSLLASATVLDPRFKLLHFQVPINTGNILQWLSREMNSEVSSSSTPQRTTAKDVSSRPSKDVPFWDLHDRMSRRSNTREMPATSTELHPELKLYLTLPQEERTKCPLKFWSDRDKTFPTLSRLAFKYLTVMGSSVPSERVVSRLNAIASHKRNRLSPAHIDMLIFMSSIERDVWFGN
ncbi:Zinc finger BED domain-containing protein 1 [Chionoecetes opilio]|uniref:Zinc finger BED domain-containing protein 1 n=1 Tax=Chionoecetes opilio TaxID=41210 RepID=A0A8J5BWB7_CHIOP|nr:Zinc finger BED domain-containing protein 1 [Chionoecetes opilio]